MTKQSRIYIAGFQKNSFIDYPGKIASVIFLGGCNFACHYCHNSDLLTDKSNTINFNKILLELKEQIGFIDGVVITGGEPTLHPHLKTIIKEIKSLGLLVKLDTNGTNSKILSELGVDYIAMDIKAPLERYKDIVGSVAIASSAMPPRKDVPSVSLRGGQSPTKQSLLEEIKASIDFLKRGTIDYMFRLTLSPFLDESDIKQVGKLIDGAKCFQLQQFVPNDFSNSHATVHLPHSAQTAKKFELLLSKHCEKVVMRGF